MEYFVNFPAGGAVKPGTWAAAMESEGWHGVCASDHLWVGTTRYPHVFVAATQMACATRTIRITTSFCNNLFRSPVEFAQAALAIQDASPRSCVADVPQPPDLSGYHRPWRCCSQSQCLCHAAPQPVAIGREPLQVFRLERDRAAFCAHGLADSEYADAVRFAPWANDRARRGLGQCADVF